MPEMGRHVSPVSVGSEDLAGAGRGAERLALGVGPHRRLADAEQVGDGPSVAGMGRAALEPALRDLG